MILNPHLFVIVNEVQTVATQTTNQSFHKQTLHFAFLNLKKATVSNLFWE